MTLHSSPLGRGAHRDDRRRRLLAEDLTANYAPYVESPPDGRSDAAAPHKSEHYGDAEFLANELRLSDLVPQRPLSAILLGVAGMVAIAGTITLYVAAPRILPATDGAQGIDALGQLGGLGNWIAALLLLAACFFAVVVYTIRRHKVDDYRGRYRVWLWAAACWFLMASDIAAGLHTSLQTLFEALTKVRIVGDGSIWWLGPTIALMGWVGIRLLIDMQPSRLSSIAMVLAATAYLTAMIASLPVVHLLAGVGRSALMHIALLAGHLLLAWSMAMHARYVLLDAQGQLPRRTVKSRAKSKRAEKSKSKMKDASASAQPPADSSGGRSTATESESSGWDGDWVAVDPPHGSAPAGPVTLRRTASPSAQADQSLAQTAVAKSLVSPSAPAAPLDGKLNKAERKALKKKLLEERVKSEQRKASNW